MTASDGVPDSDVPDDYTDRIERERAEKDEFLAEHPRSPLPHEARHDFDGLDYYPPDPDLRFELELHEHDDKEEMEIATTTGGTQDYLRWGEFRFEVDGEECALQAYKGDPDEDRLWVPFRDGTSGEETYGAGRYIDLEAEDRTDEGTWILDFNRAYNPFCAYSEAYECPFIPTENWLDVPVRAGEKDFESSEGYETEG